MDWRVSRIFISTIMIFFLLGIFFPQAKNGPQAENARTITVYAAVPNENLVFIAREFEKTTGIKVLYVSISQHDVLARVRAEKAAPQADVLLGSSLEYLLLAKKEGLLQSHTSSQINNIPQYWRDVEGYWTGLYIDVAVFVTNKDQYVRQQVEILPYVWQDLLNPKYKSKIALADPGISNATYNMFAALQQQWGAAKAFEYYQKLHQNIQQYPKDSMTPARMVGMGEMSIGVLGANDAIHYLRDGFPIIITAPTENIGYQLFGVSLLTGAPHKEEAQIFIDWILGQEGQAALLFGNLYFYPTNTKATPPTEVAFFRTLDLSRYDVVYAAENKTKLIEKWNVDVRIGRL